MSIKELTELDVKNELAMYYGTEHYYNFDGLLVTDGIKRFCELCKCFWTITDFISLKLYPIAKKQDDTFSIVEFKVDDNHIVNFRAFHDTDMPNYWVDKQKDYVHSIPIGTYQFYLIDNVLLLKSEY